MDGKGRRELKGNVIHVMEALAMLEGERQFVEVIPYSKDDHSLRKIRLDARVCNANCRFLLSLYSGHVLRHMAMLPLL